jgi:hypothetical protein
MLFCTAYICTGLRMPLTLPIASQWVPSLSPLTRGEGILAVLGRRV